ncbi:cupin [Leifsonia sp. LS1]|uniref:cupin domain-containing protein n=1 Tax=Leifsonia sp. LS1 TaxID=2828483 RepID=UPI001CFE13AF|nr:cupin domain-containing protein [Leifsonia sp. LS1]GIT80648.1 cupin [Leifsonia sp. LS1]
MTALDSTTRIPALTVPLTEGAAELGRFGGLEVGVWEMAPGTDTDVEADELFIVIAGRATIDFPRTGRRLDLAPGDVVRLSAGDETVWTVTETLRKVYIAG